MHAILLNHLSFVIFSEGGDDIDGWSVDDLRAVIAEYNHYYGGGEA